AELTRKLLNINNHPTSSTTAHNNNNNNNKNYVFNSLNFPPLPPPQATTLNNSMLSKIDDLITKITEVKEHMINLSFKQDKFEPFMLEKAEHNACVKQQLEVLENHNHDLKTDTTQHHLLIQRHENIFMKLLIPMFEDLFTIIAAQNQDKR
ncbi:unnamed protein product, partial [Rotaria sp. Silwood2]